MGDFDDAFVSALKTQSWSLYAVGMFLIVLRLFARAKRRGGIRNYQFDDYLQMLAAGLYTALIVCLNVIAQGGGSNLYPPEMEGTFTPDEIADRIYGSKIVVVSEQAMLNLIWTLKTCMLIMYTRLTLGLAQQTAVRYLSIYVAVGWAACEIAFFTACRPFQGYWGMPPPDPQCTTLQYYALVVGCFNITSDVLMLCVPLPLIAKMNVAWRQKIVLLLIFGMGVFVIVAALLTKIFNLSDVWDPSYMLWYTREASVAVYVSNLPMIWPLLKEWFPILRRLGDIGQYAGGSEGRGAGSRKKTKDSGNPKVSVTIGGSTMLGDDQEASSSLPFPLRRKRRRPRPSLDSTDPVLEDVELGARPLSRESGRRSGEFTESMEEILEKGALEHDLGGIQVQRTIIVAEERLEDEADAKVYDWEQQGGAKHRVDAEGGR